MGVTLASLAIPTVSNPFELFTVFAGLIVLLLLLFVFVRRQELSSYSGMPGLIAVLIFIAVFLGGSAVDLTTINPLIAGMLAYLVKLIMVIFLWPFVIMGGIVHSFKVVKIISEGFK